MVLLQLNLSVLMTSLTERLVEAVVVYLQTEEYLIQTHYILTYYVLVSHLVLKTVQVTLLKTVLVLTVLVHCQSLFVVRSMH